MNTFRIALMGIAGLTTLTAGACSMEQVNTGHRGVFVTFGKPTSQVGEGLHFFNPFTTSLIEMDVRQLKRTSETEAYTKDVQQADIKYSITYSLDPARALWTYQNVGEDWDTKLVPQVVEQSIKDVLGQAEAVADTINRRATVQGKIKTELRRRLAERNIVVHGFELRDISFSPAFEKAVEAKQVAVENANAAKNKTVEIEERAKQRIIAAKADAEAMKIKTQALSGNAKLVEYEAVQKWNGMLPQNMYGSGAIPFIPAK